MLNDCEKNINTIVEQLSQQKVYRFLKGQGKRVIISKSQIDKLLL
jgi:hypothetical protein